MSHDVDRRRFVSMSSAGLFAASIPAVTTIAGPQPARTRQDSARPDPIDASLVQEMVGVSHGNIDRMKELLKVDQMLANALMDWGAGDFESALGAAAHTGGRDRAELLLDHGARLDIFAAAMLGWLDVVEPSVKRKPEIVHTLGPHGITLWSHARFGGDAAREVLEYLDAIPGIVKDIRMSEEDRAARAGEYAAKGGARYTIVDRFRSLYIKEDDGLLNRLVTTGENRFHSIRDMDGTVSFEMKDGAAAAIIIETGDKRIRAVR